MTEIGNRNIKANRRQRKVSAPPHGCVSDYVPFYFAPRSPMMYSIYKGNVPTYSDGTDRLVYLVSSLERLQETGHRVVLSDRNAALKFTDYREFDPHDDVGDGFVDWDLMKEQFWTSTDDGSERRAAEALVYQHVDWRAMLGIGTKSDSIAAEATEVAAAVGVKTTVRVRPEWYF